MCGLVVKVWVGVSVELKKCRSVWPAEVMLAMLK